MAILRRNGLPVAKRISFSTLDCLQMQELPKGKDFESIFCRFDGANPDLLPDREQVTPILSTLTLRFTAAHTIRVRNDAPRQAMCLQSGSARNLWALRTTASSGHRPDFLQYYRAFRDSLNQP